MGKQYSNSSNTRQEKRRKHDVSKKQKHTFLKIFMLIMVLILIGGGIYGYNIYKNARNALDETYNPLGGNFKPARNVADVLKSGKPFSVLLMGTDTGSMGRSYVGRTDSLILATVNPDTKAVTMLSLPRDWMVSVPDNENYGFQKLNAAYEFPLDNKSHPETAMKTVQNLLNVPIDFYAVVNMGGLIKTVDKVGGVKVTSPLTFNFNPSSHSPRKYRFFEGKSDYQYAPHGTDLKWYDTMDGNAALEFSRMRDQDPQGDYGRQKRQRIVLTALLKKAGNFESLITPGFFDSIADNLRTNLSFNDIMTVIAKYRNAKDTINSENVQGIEYRYRGQSFQVVSPDEQQKATNLIRKSLDLEEDDTGKRFASDTRLANTIPSYYQIKQMSR